MRITGFILFLSLYLSYSLEARLYFMHIPKTGGSTFRFLLESQVCHQDVYPYRMLKKIMNPAKERIISGHIPFSSYKSIDPIADEAFKVTILRDPVDRYLSLLRYRKKKFIKLQHLSLNEIFDVCKSNKDERNLNFVNNTVCRYFASDPTLEGESLLNSAKQTLNQFDYIIFFDHYAEDIHNLFYYNFGIQLEKNFIPHLNSTTILPDSVDLNLFKKIQDISHLDYELYEYAKKHFQNNNRKYSPRAPVLEDLFKNKSHIEYTFDLPLRGTNWSNRFVSENNIDYPVYRRVLDYPAKIYFSLEEGHDYSLYFRACPIENGLTLQVCVNGYQLEIEQLDNELFSLYHLCIPKEYLTNNDTEITFYCDKRSCYIQKFPKNVILSDPFSFAINYISLSIKK